MILRNYSWSIDRKNDFSGADLAALIREASEIAMTEHISKSLSIDNACVHQSHLNRAFDKIIPSVSETVFPSEKQSIEKRACLLVSL